MAARKSAESGLGLGRASAVPMLCRGSLQRIVADRLSKLNPMEPKDLQQKMLHAQ